jgi:cobalt-zinc-cadmium efflux system membrane fusion protein
MRIARSAWPRRSTGAPSRSSVKLGDKVRAGQPLVELSSPNVGQLQSDAQKAMSDLTVAEKATERVHKLQAEGAVADKEVAQVDGDYRKAKSDYARTTAHLKALGVSASDPAVGVALRAQIRGRRRRAQRARGAGGARRPGGAAAHDQQPRQRVGARRRVRAGPLARRRGRRRHHPRARVPGRDLPGQGSHVGDVVDPGTRTVKIRCVADNKSRRLKPEMFAKVDVQNAAGRKIVLVPSQAVLSEGDRSVVIVASEGNVFRSRRVDVGPESEGRVRILGGLRPGEKIVTDGAIFMKRELDTQ